jgi:choline monooxygenase
MDLRIDSDIRRASMPPAAFYRDALVHQQLVDRVLARSWQCRVGAPVEPGGVDPFVWLEGSVEEALIFTRDESGELRCLSNVCTHRGALLCNEAKRAKSLLCPYHGRRFALDGELKHAPGFEGAADFPRQRDHLSKARLESWGPLRFSALGPDADFAEVRALLDRYLAHLDPDTWLWDESGRRDYPIAANWMLYCDNYLEGFHVPFVHPALSRAIEMSSYETRLVEGGVMQVAFARDGEPAFDPPPEGHPDAGRSVAAWYLLLFPNLMLNVYPWGLSLNRVRPVGAAHCVVEYARWLRPAAAADRSALEQGAGAGLDTVESEDQAVVLSAQAGLASRLYPGGRYSPTHERGLHHFHTWLAAGLSAGDR